MKFDLFISSLYFLPHLSERNCLQIAHSITSLDRPRLIDFLSIGLSRIFNNSVKEIS